MTRHPEQHRPGWPSSHTTVRDDNERALNETLDRTREAIEQMIASLKHDPSLDTSREHRAN